MIEIAIAINFIVAPLALVKSFLLSRENKELRRRLGR